MLIRVYVALLDGASTSTTSTGRRSDPWMTLVGYFNSLRELGGMRRLVEDDVATRPFVSNETRTSSARGSRNEHRSSRRS